MGFITKQFVEGAPLRNRGYLEVEGEVYGRASSSAIGHLYNTPTVFEIEIVRRGRGYHCQKLQLTQDEVDKLLPAMMEVAGESIRLALARKMARVLTGDELSFLLAEMGFERAETTVSEAE